MLKRLFISFWRFKANCFLVLFFIHSINGFAGGKGYSSADSTKEIAKTPFDPHGDYQTWVVKVKFLPFLLGNGSGINGMLGIEYGFWKRHSIGLDLNFLSSMDQNDQPANPNSPLPSYKGIDRSVVLSYRFYFDFSKLRTKVRCPVFYAELMARYGWENAIVDIGYSSDNLTAYRATHTSEGLLFGALYKPKKWNRKHQMTMDFNMGPLNKEITETNTYTLRQQNTEVSGQHATWNLHIGLSLNFWFTR